MGNITSSFDVPNAGCKSWYTVKLIVNMIASCTARDYGENLKEIMVLAGL